LDRLVLVRPLDTSAGRHRFPSLGP
jgi:hypothetical protein